MKEKAILICLALGFSNGAFAQQVAVPRLTVKTLIAYYAGQAGIPFHEQSADAISKTRLADGYLAGVADSTQGKTWCDEGKVKTNEINAMVVAELRKLSSRDQEKSAAQATLKILETKFPCK